MCVRVGVQHIHFAVVIVHLPLAYFTLLCVHIHLDKYKFMPKLEVAYSLPRAHSQLRIHIETFKLSDASDAINGEMGLMSKTAAE